jgi:hypothetical protein
MSAIDVYARSAPWRDLGNDREEILGNKEALVVQLYP